jgi:hypothetical protein
MSYIPLANVTLGASATTVTFSSIPATYQDLVLVVQALGTSNTSFWMRPNSSTNTSEYNFVRMDGNGISATSAANSGTFDEFYLGYYGELTTTERSNVKLEIFDYSQTNKHKSMLLRYGNANNGTGAHSYRWGTTAAITSILLRPQTGSFASGSTFALYGIIA